MFIVDSPSAARERTAYETIFCRYVRRELRALTDHDREAFFTAARALWRTPTSEGAAIWGAGYSAGMVDHAEDPPRKVPR